MQLRQVIQFDPLTSIESFQDGGHTASNALLTVYQHLQNGSIDQDDLNAIAKWLSANLETPGSWPAVNGGFVPNLEMTIAIISASDKAKEVKDGLKGDELCNSSHPSVRAAALKALSTTLDEAELTALITDNLTLEDSSLVLCAAVEIATDNRLMELALLVKKVQADNARSSQPDALLDDYCDEFLEML